VPCLTAIAFIYKRFHWEWHPMTAWLVSNQSSPYI
jgi:hypothetical protein